MGEHKKRDLTLATQIAKSRARCRTNSPTSPLALICSHRELRPPTESSAVRGREIVDRSIPLPRC